MLISGVDGLKVYSEGIAAALVQEQATGIMREYVDREGREITYWCRDHVEKISISL
jgi:hypothetical protein